MSRALVSAASTVARSTLGGFPAAAVVRGGREWARLDGHALLNPAVVLEGMGDIHPYSGGPVFSARDVLVLDCDKNWVYYWLGRRTFPAATRIWLWSHPCEPCVLAAWAGRPEVTLTLAGRYDRYKARWAPGATNIRVGGHGDPPVAAEDDWIVEPHRPAPSAPAAAAPARLATPPRQSLA